MTHDIEALFIDGPWDGRRVTLESHVLQQPTYVVVNRESVDFQPHNPYTPLPPSTLFHYNFMRACGSPDKSGAMYFAFPSDWWRMNPDPNYRIFAALFRGYVGGPLSAR